MEEEMGYHNALAVYEASKAGRLSKVRGDGKLSLNSFALATLNYMALNTYDWPPSERMRRDRVACRCYKWGWRNIALDLGMLLVNDLDGMEDAMQARERTAKNRISDAWKFLTEQGLIKRLVPASQGRNAMYLLLLGDEEENREVEQWARECEGLPFNSPNR